MKLFRNKSAMSSREALDLIESRVYEYVKSFGFKSHGRTLHRFVDGDISQVIHFQNGCPQKDVRDVLWVNLGIRVPECEEYKYLKPQPEKKYYQEYECTIRTRLGLLVHGTDSSYNLKSTPEEIATDIIEKIKKYVLPVYNVLDSREGILSHREERIAFGQECGEKYLIDEAMIYRRNGEAEKAEKLFRAYYSAVLAEHEKMIQNGTEVYLKQGQRLVYKNERENRTETIVAKEDGVVRTYSGRGAHLAYLEELAHSLGFALHCAES